MTTAVGVYEGAAVVAAVNEYDNKINPMVSSRGERQTASNDNSCSLQGVQQVSSCKDHKAVTLPPIF